MLKIMTDERTNELVVQLRQFAAEREWGQFHNPKNLAMALVVEAGELVEIFQWLTPEESAQVMDDPARASAVQEELADVYGYLLRLSDLLGVSLHDALEDKIKLNREKYPVEQSRGSAAKYTAYQEDVN
jgi:NTP pyrophosphatase (non-canonical NTP hydrolase)